MRVRIVFLLKNKGSFIPFHHQYLLAQLVKGVIVKGGREEYFDYEFYNFSGLKGQTKISRNGLHYYSTKVTLVLSSPNKDFIDYFLEELFKIPQVDIGNLYLTPLNVEKEQLPEFGESMTYICISPTVPLEPSFYDMEGKRFVSPESDHFSDRLYESTTARMEKIGKYTPEQLDSFFKFQVVPDQGYLNKIKESQKKFARIYPMYHQDVKYEVRGYTFPFTLYAAPEVQEFVFICGLGMFANKGFGMLDLANVDPSNRTEEYQFNNPAHEEKKETTYPTPNVKRQDGI
ncbi:MAG: CRISPR-associated endoribonuclease Cas6 [Cyclobacteriaceae bacterium]|nr:CRISPR-associated endoribonuclease Cas6 [Cyclobacteriaceae bacterium]MCH8516983.1 CRISPR-associated endoribonuclease Cas6 [Cyclobacteriaceae bacterium]